MNGVLAERREIIRAELLAKGLPCDDDAVDRSLAAIKALIMQRHGMTPR